MIHSGVYSSPMGQIILAVKDQTLIGLWWENQKYFAASVREPMTQDDSLPVFRLCRSWLDSYFAGEKPKMDCIPMHPSGSPFRQNVWKLLLEIPYGQIVTYKDLAQKIAAIQNRPHMSSQAVGGAVAHNPISILIPCHRVIGSNGSLTGYAGGLEKKKWLLTHEGVFLEDK